MVGIEAVLVVGWVFSVRPQSEKRKTCHGLLGLINAAIAQPRAQPTIELG